MKAREFVHLWKREKEKLLRAFTDPGSSTLVAEQIRRLDLPPEKQQQLVAIIDGVLTDTLYTLLLGLDGSASIGGIQQTYKLYGEDGELISDCGDIEGEAGEAFP